VSLSDLDAPDFQARVQDRRAKRMERFDAMPRELRDLVNAYGFAIVDACLTLGVTKPNQIKHLVETVLDNFSPTRGSFSAQGKRSELARVERVEKERGTNS
jgi:hypothetical protein